MNTIRFNTGRKYTAQGQRIVATLHDDGVVTFMDHSRGVSGEFTLEDHTLEAVDVMHAYDRNLYTGSARSWADGMLRGGVNTEEIK
jgi:hypothetical protein